MIWFTLGLFAVSFVLTALLAPKPKLENARPDEFDPEAFPRATEDSPIPIIGGKVRFSAPNTIWYGNFRSVPVTERVKVSLFKKKTVVTGHNYYLDLHLALTLGPGTKVRKIFYDDKEIWSGDVSLTGPTAIDVIDSTLLGGEKNGGGISFSAKYYSGSFDLAEQPVNTDLQDAVGIPVPAYLGVAHMFFKDFWIGESPSLRNMAFVLENYSNHLGLPDDGKVGEDLNPAEALYQIITNSWQGAGQNPGTLNLTALRALGQICYDEGNGVSYTVTSSSNAKTVVEEILRQIDAIGYQDPETGQIVFRAIRQDYDVEDLPIYDENDIIQITNFSRTAWEDVFSEVKISYPQRDKESNAVAVAQDMATITMLGSPNSTGLSFPFCYNPDTAAMLASREQGQLGTPLFSMTVEMNRNGARLRPGDVIALSWEEYGFDRLIMRVQSFDLGSLTEGRIVVSLMQDTFATSSVVFKSEGSAWTPPVTTPETITNIDTVQVPYPIRLNTELILEKQEPAFVFFAEAPSTASTGFDVHSGPSSSDLFSHEENMPYSAFGRMTTAYSAENGRISGIDSTVGIGLYDVTSKKFTSATTSSIKDMTNGIIYANGEWMAYITATDTGAETQNLTTIYRGLFGTVPKNHPIGTPVWAFSTDNVQNWSSLSSDAETLYYKVLDRKGVRTNEISTAPLRTKTTPADLRPGRKCIRPTYARIANVRDDLLVNTKVDRTLTWIARHVEDNRVLFEQDIGFSVPNNEPVTYDVVTLINGVPNSTLSENGVSGTSYSMKFGSTSIVSNDCEVRVFSVVNGSRSQEYTVCKFRMNQPA